MASSYKLMLRLLEKWPADASKAGRDIGSHIRERIAQAYRHGPMSSEINEKECERIYNSLNRLASNYYGSKYPRRTCTASTGLTNEQCHLVISNAGLEELNKERGGIVATIKDKVRSMESLPEEMKGKETVRE